MAAVVFAGLLVAAAQSESGREHGPSTGSLLVLSAVKTAEADLAELLGLRKSQGWQVTIRYTLGTSPTALAALVAAEQERHPALSHVLLVGSDSALPLGRRRDSSSRRSALSSAVLTDEVYGLPGANGMPQLSVGRLPTNDPAVLRRLAAKTVLYERELGKLAPEVFLLTGRQPADDKPILGGISQQTLADGMGKALIEEVRQMMPRLPLRARTAFPGTASYTFEESPGVLRDGLAARPMMAAYAGHAGRDYFATCHDSRHIEGIRRSDVSAFELTAVCGPFVSGGCSMLNPQGHGPAIGEVLLLLQGGPVAVVGFTGVNDDYYAGQFFEVWAGELSTGRRTTLGEIVRTVKQRMVSEPQSPGSALIQSFLGEGTANASEAAKARYSAAMRNNNAMLILVGDPTATVVIP